MSGFRNACLSEEINVVNAGFNVGLQEFSVSCILHMNPSIDGRECLEIMRRTSPAMVTKPEDYLQYRTNLPNDVKQVMYHDDAPLEVP